MAWALLPISSAEGGSYRPRNPCLWVELPVFAGKTLRAALASTVQQVGYEQRGGGSIFHAKFAENRLNMPVHRATVDREDS